MNVKRSLNTVSSLISVDQYLADFRYGPNSAFLYNHLRMIKLTTTSDAMSTAMFKVNIIVIDPVHRMKFLEP